MTKTKIRAKVAKANSKTTSGKAGQPEKKTKKLKIKNKEVYELAMEEIDLLMKKGEGNLTSQELERLLILTDAAENYEDEFEPLQIPSSLSDMIRLKMLQLKLSQHFAAKLLGVSEAKFSLIMNGKQKPDIFFIKAIHVKLKLDANQILEAI